MSGTIYQKNIIIYSGMGFFLFFNFFFSYSSNQLVKISQNVFEKDIISQEDNAKKIVPKIELSRIEFYFSEKPVINFVPTRQKFVGQQQAVFIFPQARINKETFDTMINNINKKKSRYYSVYVEQIKKPVEGIKILITFDPEQVTFEYKFFESVKSEQGVVFSFYNKKLLDALQRKEFYVLRTI